MKRAAKILAVGLLLAVCFRAAPGLAGEEGILPQVARANDLYLNKKYREAADLYERLIDRGFENGYLYYNLGNAYFRLHRPGRAILNYSRAKKLIPRFEDLDANLRYVARQTEDKIIETRPPFLKNIIFWLDDFSPREYALAILAVNGLFWLTLMAWLYFGTSALGLARNVLLAVLLVTTVSAGARFYTDSRYPSGVVLEKQIDVKSAQGTDNVTLFQLHEGAVVNIRDEAEGWYKIELLDGKKGWAPKNGVGRS
ncbi:MAG: SH3 domain-containing protein [Nitrospinales bacterium]